MFSIARFAHRTLRQFNKNITFNSHLNARVFSGSETAQPKETIQIESIQISEHLKPYIETSANEILSNIEHNSISPSQSVTILKALRMKALFNNVDADSFVFDDKFRTLCEVFGESCHKMTPTLLISGLRSLLELGLQPNTECVITAEKSMLNRLSQFSVFQLIRSLHFHHKYMQDDLQKKVVSLLIDAIETRVSEINNSAEILMLVQVLHQFVDKQKIEQKIAELLELLSIHEMCKVLLVLAENSCRSLTILKALSVTLQDKEVPEMKETIDVLYALNKLSFYDPKLLKYLLNDRVAELSSIEHPSSIAGFLTTLGYLRWKNLDLLAACDDWITKNLDSCCTREFVAYILTSASLNYKTSQSEHVLNLILPRIVPEIVGSPLIWLDIVWSLAILESTQKEMLQNVLTKKFFEPLIKDTDYRSTSNKLKLMNLKAVMRNKYPECIFGCELFVEPSEIPQNTALESSRKHVIKILSNFVPKEKFLVTNQYTDMGVYIDAEFIMDENLKPLAISEYGTMSKPTGKPLPKKSKRIALLIMFHKDYMLNEKALTGINILATKLLDAQSYAIVQVPYDDFSRNKTEVKKLKYLLQSISSSVKQTVL